MGIGPGMVKLQITIAASVLERVGVLATEAGMTKSQYLTMLINEKWKEGNHAVKRDMVE